MENLIKWLLEGDMSIVYMTHKYLLQSKRNELEDLQIQVENHGYAKDYLRSRNQDGLWGVYYYQPKWTSTHYTLLDLKNMEIDPRNEICRTAVNKLIKDCMIENGGFNLAKSMIPNDNCIDGMILNYSSYFLKDVNVLEKTVDLLISSQQSNGGFVQYKNAHADEHATICVLEGLLEFRKRSTYRYKDLKRVEQNALNFFFKNNLFMDNKEPKVIHYPFRYYYSVLRFLNYCADAKVKKNKFIDNAISYLVNKRSEDGLWNIDGIYKGSVHSQIEAKKKPSRFVTIMCLKILTRYMAIPTTAYR